MKEEEILEEINRIASIHASSKLMKLNKRIANIQYLNIGFKTPEDFVSFVGEKEITVNISLDVKGALDVKAVLVFPKKSTLIMCDLLQEKEIGATTRMNKMDKDCLKEVGNVILGNYLTVFSNRLNVKLLPRVPVFNYGRFKLNLSEFLKGFAKKGEDILCEVILFDFDPFVIKLFLFLVFISGEIKKALKAV